MRLNLMRWPIVTFVFLRGAVWSEELLAGITSLERFGDNSSPGVSTNVSRPRLGSGSRLGIGVIGG